MKKTKRKTKKPQEKRSNLYKPVPLIPEKTKGPKVGITQMQLVFYEMGRRGKSKIILRADLMLLDMGGPSPPTTMVQVVESSVEGIVAATVGNLSFVRGHSS